MIKLSVDLGDRSYDILIYPGSLVHLGDALKGSCPHEKILVVTDEKVGDLYLEKALESLRGADFNAKKIILPRGEENKNLSTVERIYQFLAEHNFSRQSTLIALGGGVVGDITGFAAATYMRGVNFVQVPTTLLAMVDSSVGGKTGVNHALGKNMIGAFYQPKLVCSDTSLLETLEPEEFRAGMAEVIKYGMIYDDSFFEHLTDNMERLINEDWQTLDEIIKRCCEIKAAVVSSDETEKGIRAILNFGHTVGHAIEAQTGYRKYRHGEAVAIGMIAESRIALKLEMISDMDIQRLWQLIVRARLPYRIGDLDSGEILEKMKKDKKVREDKLRFVLPTQIGEVVIRDDVPEAIILDVLEDMKE